VNLLDNAMKYSPAGRTIGVRLRRDVGGPITFEVSDDGIGIAPDRVEHVFDRFYRAHADQGLGGLGLGLYITREIVERHGGQIEARSEEHRGTTFTITIPGHAARADASPAAASVAEEGPQTRRRVLVVDDDPDVRALVASILHEAGHEVTVARDGEDALVAARQRRPDLILLDKLMPVMDGTAFARAYRAAERDAAPIVAFCAARDADEWARSISAVAHVVKPFEIADLERVIGQQLTQAPGAAV
jgi:CheY-like chemotaxis protein